jgi:hypothetical protein
MSDEDEAQAARYQLANEGVYGSEPWSHFRIRATGLILTGSGSEHLSRAAEEGVSHMGLVSIEPPNDDLTEDEAQRHLDRHIAVDSQILLHQVAEAVLRIYFEHVDDEPCPWLATVRKRNWRVFEDRCATRYCCAPWTRRSTPT